MKRFHTVKHFSGFTYGIADTKNLEVTDTYDDTVYKYDTLKQLKSAWEFITEESIISTRISNQDIQEYQGRY